MQEIKRFIGAGGSDYVDAAGDFIFCAFADRTFRIVIDGKSLTVSPGDKLRPQKRFQNFQIENLDASNEMAVRLIVGEGDYNSQIIQGEVTVMPGVRGADGQWRDDTRHKLSFDIVPRRVATKLYAAGTLINTSERMDYLMNSVMPSDVSASSIGLGQTDTGWFLSGKPKYDIQMDVLSFDNDFNLLDVSAEKHATIEKVPFKVEEGAFDACRIGGIYYYISDGSTLVTDGNRVAYWAPGTASAYGTLFDFGAIGRAVFSVCPYKGSILAMTVGGSPNTVRTDARWHVISQQGEILREGSFPVSAEIYGWDKVRYWHAVNAAVIKTQDGMVLFDPDSGYLEEVVEAGALTGTRSGWVPLGRHLIRYDDGARRLRRQVFRDFDSPIQLDIISNACNEWEAITEQKTDQFHTLAAVTAEKLVTGEVRVKGEVIRAVLEFYFKRFIDDDYLDHAYYFSTNGDPFGGTRIIKNGGGNSLRKIGVLDDFDINIPANFEITIDQSLGLGEPGEV